jgi:thioredoxin 1
MASTLETFSRVEVDFNMSRDILAVDEETFPSEVLAAEVPVLVEFGARWCGPCRALDPVLRRMAQEANGRWRIATVDIDESPGLVNRYRVRGAPTMIVFANGAEAGRHLGLARRETLAALLEGATSHVEGASSHAGNV